MDDYLKFCFLSSFSFLFNFLIKDYTPPRIATIFKWTKILSLEITIFGLKMMVKSGLEKNILKFHVPLQSCYCSVQKKLPSKAELA